MGRVPVALCSPPSLRGRPESVSFGSASPCAPPSRIIYQANASNNCEASWLGPSTNRRFAASAAFGPVLNRPNLLHAELEIAPSLQASRPMIATRLCRRPLLYKLTNQTFLDRLTLASGPAGCLLFSSRLWPPPSDSGSVGARSRSPAPRGLRPGAPRVCSACEDAPLY